MPYETAVPIGRGAGGEVFKAWDPENGRPVALKYFPPDAGPDDVARREREAAAQARLDHPSVCEIYEVGTTPGGRSYLAMRYVDGEPLDRVCARLPLRRRLELLHQVADAVRVAHEAGLVHRDLKPSNLLVEEQDDGSLRAFVLDFGIVRMEDRTRLTETGQVLGTPGYLSPEQARGAPEVDARSDVFSLGVLLYQLLTGVVPFESTSEVGALLQVLEKDPPLAHVVRPGVPPELGHIAQKALEKDPRRRYGDAGAFARDLERYLADGTTSARAVGWLGRLLRRAERRPALWAGGFALGLLALLSLGWGLWNRLESERQTRAAEVFTRRAAEVEARWRFVELLPRHAVTAERLRLRAAVDALRRDVEATRGRARAAGRYALGRAELALGRVDVARADLAAARDLGVDDPAWSVDWARAEVAAAGEELRQIERLADPEVRADYVASVRDDLRRRVLPELRRAETDPEPSTEPSGDDLDAGEHLLVRALAALVDERFDEARRIAERIAEAEPWRIEADLVAAAALRATAVQAALAADDDVARRALGDEAATLRDALVRAPSAPALHLRLCENRLALADLESLRQAPVEHWRTAYDEAETACDAAVAVVPGDRDAASRRVEVAWRSLLTELRRTGPQGLLAEAERWAARARQLTREPDAGAAEFENLGNALYVQAQTLRELGSPEPDLLEDAAEALAAAAQRAPGSGLVWQSLGMAWSRHGQAVEAVGGDPRASYLRAAEALRRGLGGVRSHEARLWNVICTTWSSAAYWGQLHRDVVEDAEIDEALRRGDEACTRALDLDRTYASALSNAALLHWTRVEWQILQGRDPTAEAERGRQRFAQLFEVAPEHVSGRINYGGLVAALARWRLDETDAPDALLIRLLDDVRDARRRVAPLLERFPLDAAIQLARLRTLEAAVICRLQPDVGGSGAAEKAAAWRAGEEAVERLDAHGAWRATRAVVRAEFHRRRAACLPSGAADDLESARAALADALAADPAHSDALAERRRVEELARSLRADG